ncbi:MAG: VWA domain-containing protein, partial [Oscillospiraceae bacterium]|nr:VWA domain-containing protein [Oscillospiraceae bacterium]
MKKKTSFKRILSGLMGAAVLASSLFSANVFAADDSTAASVQAEKQIVSAEVTEDFADGKVNITKSVAATGVENEFEVTVEVETTETIQEITSSPDAAVVLVLDVSNSMKGTDLTNAKDAAKNFIDDYVKDAGNAERMLSIVQFGSNALTVMDWTNVNGAAANAKSVIDNKVKIKFTYSNTGCTYYGCSLTDASHTHNVWSESADWVKTKNNYGSNDEYTCTVCGVKDTASGRQFCELHQHNKSFWESHNVTDEGGTNIEGGLRLANNLLADSAVSDIETTYVIMMTDGLPTFYVDDEDTTTSAVFMKGSSGCYSAPNNNCSNSNDYTDVPDVVDSIQETAKMYVVGCGLSGTVNRVDVKNWLTNDSHVGIDQYFDAANSSQLSQYFKNIATIIKNAAQAWIMEDPMGESIDFVDGVSVNMQGTTATESDDNITWNLKDDATFTTTTVGDVTTYTYTMTYKVKLDTTSEAFLADEDGVVPTNGTITLTYMVTDENGEIDPELKTATFEKSPMVKGYLGEKFEFQKVDSRTGKALGEAEFTLKRGETVVATAVSDENGKVVFEDIPSGFTYTITETKTPDGYTGTDEVYTLTVAYGEITVVDKAGNALTVVENDPVLYEVNYEFVGSVPADAADILPESAEYAKDESVVIAADPETTDNLYNWEFAGWFVDKECTKEAFDFTMPENDVTIYGKWNVKTSPVTPAAAAYKTEYYFQTAANSDTYAINEDLTTVKTAALGETVNAEIKTFNGYVYNMTESETSGVVVMPTVGEAGVEILTLKVYYDLIPATPVTPAAAAYKVEYYFEKTVGEADYELDAEASYIRTAALGAEVTPDELTVNGYGLNKELSDASGIVVMPTAGEDGAPVILTLKVYFDLIPATPVTPAAAAYKVEYYFEKTVGEADYELDAEASY